MFSCGTSDAPLRLGVTLHVAEGRSALAAIVGRRSVASAATQHPYAGTSVMLTVATAVGLRWLPTRRERCVCRHQEVAGRTGVAKIALVIGCGGRALEDISGCVSYKKEALF